MLKYGIVGLLAVVLVGCESESLGSKDKDTTPEYFTVEVNGTGTISDIDRDDKYNLSLSGTNISVYIAESNSINTLDMVAVSGATAFIGDNTTIDFLDVGGSSSSVVVGLGVTILECDISGSGAIINLPTGDSLPCSVGGSGGSIEYY